MKNIPLLVLWPWRIRLAPLIKRSLERFVNYYHYSRGRPFFAGGPKSIANQIGGFQIPAVPIVHEIDAGSDFDPDFPSPFPQDASGGITNCVWSLG
jgi:hypothetical protein